MEKYTRMSGIFGAMSGDLEQVRVWVEALVGTPSEAHESSDRGGDYYLFTGEHGEEIHVMKNEDVYDGEPIVDADAKWQIVVTIDEAPSDSKWLAALSGAATQLERLSLKEY